MRILFAEDEHALGEWLSKALNSSGFQVDWVSDGRLAEASLLERPYDALILDLGLPGRSGRELLRRLRSHNCNLPVLILTARDSLAERVGTLNEGADDFLAKPFALAELEARLAALIRRSSGQYRTVHTCGPLQFDSDTRQFKLHDELLYLTPREATLLATLIEHSKQPVSKQQLLRRVFEDKEDVMIEAVEVIIHRLRKRLEKTEVQIITMRGLGYALEEA
jgi:two-component system response regulator TctD